MKYYKVNAKCGHVGRGHYTNKDFFVKAKDGKEAAYRVRFAPRVKHDWKYAINFVELITRDEFERGCERQNNDLYFMVTNSSEQKVYCAVDYEQIFDYEVPEKKTKDKDSKFYKKMSKIQRRELRTQLAEVI